VSALRGVRARELTPRGAGAVSVVEYLGPDAVAHVRELGGPSDLQVGDVRLARLCFGSGLVDEALVVCRASDRVEVHLHGSPALARAACAGFETANAARGALEDRARALLETAPCESAARILLDQAEGALRAELARLADLDAAGARALADALAVRGRRARFALEPARIVLAGPVNAGKSTLFNVLAGEARALVAELPGTTRDVLAADVALGAWPARVLDTAGERALPPGGGAAAVEAEGQRRARLARADADLVLWLVPATQAGECAPDGAVLVLTQADRSATAPAGAISALADPSGARRRVEELLRECLDLPRDPWRAGEAVPCEPALVEDLSAAARGELDPRTVARTWLVRT